MMSGDAVTFENGEKQTERGYPTPEGWTLGKTSVSGINWTHRSGVRAYLCSSLSNGGGFRHVLRIDGQPVFSAYVNGGRAEAQMWLRVREELANWGARDEQ